MRINHRIKMLFAKLLIPFGRATAKISKRECLITTRDVESLKKLIQGGDLLFERCDPYFLSDRLSNWFIPGPYKHVAVYLDGYVYEAVTLGVRKVALDEWMYKKDHVGVGRIHHFPFDEEKFSRGMRFLEKQIGSGYRYNFIIPHLSGKACSKKHSAWFCAEYVYGFLLSCEPAFGKMVPLRKVWGEKTMTPDDFWNTILPVATFN